MGRESTSTVSESRGLRRAGAGRITVCWICSALGSGAGARGSYVSRSSSRFAKFRLKWPFEQDLLPPHERETARWAALVVLLPTNDHLAWHISRNRLRCLAEPPIEQRGECGDANPGGLVLGSGDCVEAVGVEPPVLAAEGADVFCQRLPDGGRPAGLPLVPLGNGRPRTVSPSALIKRCSAAGP
jgi:hypothetical protein